MGDMVFERSRRRKFLQRENREAREEGEAVTSRLSENEADIFGVERLIDSCRTGMHAVVSDSTASSFILA